MKTLLNILKTGAIWLLIIFVILEVFLRIYNPFDFSVEGDKIKLHPNVRTTYEHQFKTIPPKPFTQRNNIGLQGRDYQKEADQFRIYAVGGSTTKCDLISTPFSWPLVLDSLLQAKHPKTWVNNAGFSRHTTFGHQILLEDILLDFQPDMILLLAGANDRGLNNIHKKDTYIFKDNRNLENASWKGKLYFFLIDHSKVISMLNNFRRAAAASENVSNYGGFFDPSEVETMEPIPDSVRQEILQAYEKRFVDNYRQRLEQFVKTCQEHDIQPVLMTQPILYGQAYDKTYNTPLAKIKVPFALAETLGIPLEHIDGLTEEAILQLHNKSMIDLAKQLQVPLIDLAAKMPKSFDYFYDPIHYNQAGCAAVARIVFEALEQQNLL